MRDKMFFKEGAASFYIVAFSTLILMIMAASFSAIIISEITRTQNDDLSQSAYDSALAGVEDAKLAYSNYLNCLNSSASAPTSNDITCANIVYWMENPNCDMVGRMLGRIDYNEEKEVPIQESASTSEVNNNMAQYYTCVKIKTELSNTEGSLSKTIRSKVIKVDLDGLDDYSRIKTIKFSWYKNNNASASIIKYTSLSGAGIFPPLTQGLIAPPVISVGLVQTANEFKFSDFDATLENETNRGMLYFTPTGDSSLASNKVKADGKYVGAYDNSRGMNYVTAIDGFLKSNNKASSNLPFVAYCPKNSGDEYLCSVTIELPLPIGGKRNNDTFFFVVSLPYGQPATDFSVEYYCGEGDKCGKTSGAADEESETTINRAVVKGNQIEVDSTGRANDLYRRVRVRLEGGPSNEQVTSISPIYAMQILNNDKSDSGDRNLNKNLKVTREYGLSEGWEDEP